MLTVLDQTQIRAKQFYNNCLGTTFFVIFPVLLGSYVYFGSIDILGNYTTRDKGDIL